MNNVFIKSKNKLSLIILKNIIFLLPIIIYGIYKNGVLLYNKNIIEFYMIFKVLYLIVIGISLDIIKKIIFKEKILFDYDILYMTIIALFMPYNINLILYSISIFGLLILYHFISKIFNINKVSFIICIIYLIIFILNGIYMKNPLEELNIYSFSNWDLIFGRNIGGIASTGIIFGFMYLFLNSVLNNYKYIIPLVSILTYYILSIIIQGFNISIFINSSVILSLILIAPLSEYTPNRRKIQTMYGVLLGILCSLLSILFDYYIGTFLGILIANLIYVFILGKKENKIIIQ